MAMGRRSRMFVLMAGAAMLVPAGAALAKPAAQAAEKGRAYDVPAGTAAEVLNGFAAQAGIQLLYPYDAVAGRRLPGLRGTFRRKEALRQLIRGLPLVVAKDAGNTITLRAGRSRPSAAVDPRPAAAPVKADMAADDREVVVTGTRLQNQAEIANKRASRTVVDTLTQDDTGDLADQSLAEALRRIPGVSTIYDEDEGSLVTIRGIQPDWNHVTVDGLAIMPVGTGGAGKRQVDMALIPSQSARTTQVFKTFTADLDASAVGGVLNIVPRSAFDRSRRTQLLVDVYANYFTYDEVPSGNSVENDKKSPVGGGFNATFASRFGASEEFGIVAIAGYQTKQRDQSKPATPTRLFFTDAGQETTVDDPDWNGIAAPDAFVAYSLTNRLRNYGGSLRLEYKPSPAFYGSLLLFGYNQDESETRNANNFATLDRPANITATTGDFRVREVRVAYRAHTYDRATRGAQFHSVWRPDEASSLRFAAGHSFASYEDEIPDIVYAYQPNTRLYYDASGFTPTFSLDNAERYADPANYALKNATFTHEDTRGKLTELKLDYARNTERGDLGLGVRAGLNWRRTTLNRDNSYVNYVSDRTTLAGLDYDPGFTPWGFPYPMVWLDGRRFLERKAPGLAVNETTSAADSDAEDYRYRETIKAGYGELSYATDRFLLIAGLRYDATDLEGFFRQTLNGVPQPGFASARGDYDNLLPSFNASFDLSEHWRLKAAFSKTIGRPNPRDVASAETRDDTELTIRRGNPDIRPRKADNYDLALEHYFNRRNGLASVTLFAKDVTDDIFTQRTELEIDGETYSVRQPINAQKSTLRGIEFALINNRIRLPGIGDGLGVSFNATRLWGEMTFPVATGFRTTERAPFLMDWTGNLAVYYTLPGGGEVRFAGNYQSAYLDTLGDTPSLDQGWQDFLTFDLTARVPITDRFLIKAQARNLTNANRITVFGDDLRYRQSELEFGQSFYLNLIFKL